MIEKERNLLISKLESLHTTELGSKRIQQNINKTLEDVVYWCQEKILQPDSTVIRKGKNWYVFIEQYKITINASSLTIITVHCIK